MNLPPFPEIEPNEHPEQRSFKLTNMEISWIKNQAYIYGQACRKQALEEAAQIAEHTHPSDFAFIGAKIRSLIK